jgi:hypothetical protein
VTTLRKLLRTTTFRTAIALAILFAVATSLTIVYIYENTRALLDYQLSEALLSETLGLAEQYQHGGIDRLAAGKGR